MRVLTALAVAISIKKATNYVAQHYINNFCKTEKEVVSVKVYGIFN
jgi:hypothetical protein